MMLFIKKWLTFRIMLLLVSSMLVLSTTMIISSFVSGYASDSAKKQVIIATATTGGTAYPLGVAVAQLFVEKSDWADARAITSAGSNENVNLLESGEVTIGIINNNIGARVWKGIGDYEGRGQDDLRVLAPAQLSHYQLLALKSANIKSISDIKGKRFVLGRPGSGNEVTTRAILASFGLTTDDFKADYLGQNEALETLRDRKRDATMLIGCAPIGPIIDVLTTTDHVELVELSQEEIQKVVSDYKNWLISTTLKGGTYPGYDQDITVWAHAQYFFTKEGSFTEDEAYDFLDLLYNNLDWLAQAHAVFTTSAYTQPLELLETYEVPLHPGAEKYYKEKMGLK